MQNTSFLKLVVIYVTIVIVVLLWSGTDQQKTLYDRYLIRFQGIELESKDLEGIKHFLIDYLEFELKSESTKNLQISLPDKKLINIKKHKAVDLPDNNNQLTTNPSITLIIKVKNGIYPLFHKLQEKLKQTNYQNSGINLDEIKNIQDNNEFTIKGPEGLTLVFSQRTFFSK